MSLVRALASITAFTALSRVAGFVRDVLTAAILGAGPVADAFFVALKLPNFFRRISAEGAFAVAFVPLYTEKLERGDAGAFASQALSLMLLVIGAFCAVAMVAMPLVLLLVAPGFEADGQRYALALDYTRITFPYLLFMSLSALIGGALNAHGRFAPFAFAPVLFNLCLIAALGAAHAQMIADPGLALSLGVAVAGVVQLAFLVTCTRGLGLRLRLPRPRLTADMRRLMVLMGPGVLGAGAMQVNLFADMVIGSFLPAGAISHIYYADRLEQLPLGTVGIALGTALLPMLSRAVAGEEETAARSLFSRALTLCFALGMPAAVGLFLLAEPIIRTLFGYGAFTETDVAATSEVLRAYAIGMPAYIAVKVYSSVCWARQDTMTPVKTALVCTTLNIVLALVLIFGFGWGAEGIALATSVAGWMQLALLIWALRADPVVRVDCACLGKIALGVALMAGVVWAAEPFFVPGDAALARVLALAPLIALGVATYGAVLLAAGFRRSYAGGRKRIHTFFG
ncbi:MAG: murein biosynthesis integral membrane protein MurJ [Alphaproteobacteria bacterium]|jgi:putative peptidoglycan lipid II flippase|nr:murein biosynthesis integral membrane protein MurJ [Alphaproteobacteria bacterium]